MKSCKKCGLSEPAAGFYKSDPRQCKECVKARVRANRAANAEYYRAYDRLRFYERGHRGTPSTEAQKRRAEAWVSRNREKRAAHVAVGNAVRDGSLTRPDACETCGTECVPHGHHDDYSKPLVVRWLCVPCHAAWHRKYDKEATRELVESRRAEVKRSA